MADDPLMRAIKDAALFVEAQRIGRSAEANALARRLALYMLFFPVNAIHVAPDMATVTVRLRRR